MSLYISIHFYLNLVLNKCNTISGRQPVRLTVNDILARLDDSDIELSGSEVKDSR